MGRRSRKGGAGEGSSAMDIMTALIGCLILILLGILVIVLVSQVMVTLASPDEKQVTSVVESYVDGFRESDAFPEGNKFKEPLYVDVHPDKVVVYPYDEEFSQRKIIFSTSDYDTMLDVVASRPDKEYVLFLVRPQAASLFARLRKQIEHYNEGIKEESQRIEMGMELYESDREIDAGMTTREREGFQEWDLQEFRNLQEQKRLKEAEARAAGGQNQPEAQAAETAGDET